VQRKLFAVGLSLGMRFGEEGSGAEASGDPEEAPIAGLASRFGHPDAMGTDLPAGPGGSVSGGSAGPMEVFTMGD